MGFLNRKKRVLNFMLVIFLICGGVGFGLAKGTEYYERNNVEKHVNHQKNYLKLEGSYLGSIPVSQQNTDGQITMASFDYFEKKEDDLKNKLSSEYAILVRKSDGLILLDKYATERMYPASLTKLMTALVAIEHLQSFDTEIELTGDIFVEIERENASVAGFQKGEKAKAVDLLYGVLLPSGAECCLGLSSYLAGDTETFVGWMNEKAAELGMENTHFCNTVGLQDSNHYSTAYDMALLLEKCMENEVLKNILMTKKYCTQSTNLHPDGFTMYSTTLSKIEDTGIEASEVKGGKTGFTTDAGLCLASFAQIDNEEYLLVTAGARGNSRSKQYNIYDAIEVYRELEQ